MIDNPLIIFLNTYGAGAVSAAVILYLWFGQRDKKQARNVFISGALAYFVSMFMKNLFDIARPYATNGEAKLAGEFTDGSFPSFHAALSFAMATTVVLKQRKFGAVLFVAAALMSLGRVVANVHYPIDVGFGAVIGMLIGLLVDKLAI